MTQDRTTLQLLAPWVAVAGSIGLAAASVQARAQDPVAPWLRYNVGKVVILPHLDVASLYTDNLFSLGSGLRFSDVITSVMPGLRLKWDENAQVDASVNYRHGEMLIWDNSDFNSTSDTIEAQLGYSTPKLQVRATATYSDTLALQGGQLNLGRQLLGTKRAGGQVRAVYDWTPKTDLIGSIRYDLSDYDSLFLLDQQQLEGHMGGTHELTSKLRLTFDGKGGWTQVTPNQLLQPSVNSLFYGALVGVRGTFTPKLTGSVKLGYEARDLESGLVSASTPAFSVDVTYLPNLMTQVVLAYDRSTGVAPWIASQITVTDTVRLQANKAIGTTGRWIGSGSAKFALGEFQWDATKAPAGSLDLGRSDQMLGLELALQYKPQAWLACTASYSHDRYEVNFDDPRAATAVLARSYHANRVTLMVSLGF